MKPRRRGSGEPTPALRDGEGTCMLWTWVRGRVPLMACAAVLGRGTPVDIGLSETVAVDGRERHAATFDFIVREIPTNRTIVVQSPEWIHALVSRRGVPSTLSVDSEVTVAPIDGPAALTVVVDTSESMRPSAGGAATLIAGLLQDLDADDMVRLIAFNARVVDSGWRPVQEVRAAALRGFFHYLAATPRAEAAEICLESDRPGPGSEMSPQALSDWVGDCDLGAQRRIEREALVWYARGLNPTGAPWGHCQGQPPTNEPNGEAALVAALGDLRPQQGSGGAFAGAVGLLTMGDEQSFAGLGVPDDTFSSVLTQRWCLSRSGAAASPLPEALTGPIPHEDAAAAAATSIAASLRAVMRIHVETLTVPGREPLVVRVDCTHPGGLTTRVVAPSQATRLRTRPP